jgi:hypothetical protein
VLATAALVVVAVQYSDFGKSGAVVNVEGSAPAPPRASPIAVRLANAIGRASLGPRHRVIDMSRVAPLAWERVYVFASQTSADIRRRLGFAWPGAPPSVPRPGERESLLVFVQGRKVAASAFLSDAIGGLDCLIEPSGYPRGTRFLVRFTRGKPPAPLLSTRRPGLAERRCLHAAGVG